MPVSPAQLAGCEPICRAQVTLLAKKIPDAVFRTADGICGSEAFVEGDHEKRSDTGFQAASGQGHF
tara:strand:+ start:1155 stop:1352 length:198 start_codon:yes stop_codon:yes gene_type:complete